MNPQTLPVAVWLTFDGAPKPIDGQIVWRTGREAGIEFSWDNDA